MGIILWLVLSDATSARFSYLLNVTKEAFKEVDYLFTRAALQMFIKMLYQIWAVSVVFWNHVIINSFVSHQNLFCQQVAAIWMELFRLTANLLNPLLNQVLIKSDFYVRHFNCWSLSLDTSFNLFVLHACIETSSHRLFLCHIHQTRIHQHH